MSGDAGRAGGGRDRDAEGRARNARPRDGLGRPLPYGAEGVARQPEGVVRGPAETVREAQRLLDAGMPFHAHEVFEDAWKSGPEGERELWQGLAQLAVGLTHAARGNTTGGARLLRRGAGRVAAYADGGGETYGLDVSGLVAWAGELAARVEVPGREGERAAAPPPGGEGGHAATPPPGGEGGRAAAPPDAAGEAPRLTGA
ncbi:DUF309 domain-containing protein [Streptomyces sp. NPDC127049]|uniref:DUF309 domain-containing protein n=1 Tax=Streptomyces sp. NPDC127049 TaxID=3347118 RepID=UPI0036493219